jgi:hypothetical protein
MSKFTQFIPGSKDGTVRGDTADLPMKTEGSFATDSYGASLDPSATNAKGKITGATQSDPFAKDHTDPELV